MKKLILNICTLMVTTALLIVVCLAWYTSNKNVSANGIIASTLGEEYLLNLERGTIVDENGTKEWEWKDTKSLSFVNLNPGNVFYFRIVIDAPADSSFSATISLDRVSSELQEGKLVVDNGFVCKRVINSNSITSSSNVKLYKIDEENKVKANVLKDNGTSTNKGDYEISKTLYSISDSSISLVDLKIENVFRFYKFKVEPEINENILEQAASLTGTNNVKFKSLNNVKEQYELNSDSDGKAYLYFALEFNDEDSLALIDNEISSNAYLYQKLIIGAISVTTNKNENASNNGN